MTGHCLAYADNVADESARVLPTAELAGREASVCLEGPPGAVRSGSRLRSMLGNVRALRCNAAHVVDWLRAARFINPFYYTVVVRELSPAAVIAAAAAAAAQTAAAAATTAVAAAAPGSGADGELDELGAVAAAATEAAAATAATAAAAAADLARQPRLAGSADFEMEQLRATLVDNPHEMPWASPGAEAAAARARSDITRTDNGVTEGFAMRDEDSDDEEGGDDDNFDGTAGLPTDLMPGATLVADRFLPDTVRAATLGVLRAVAAAIPPEEMTGADGATLPIPRAVAVPDVIGRLGPAPLNDYEQRNEIFYGAFLTTLPLGQGLGPGDGPLGVDARRFLLSHFSRGPARNQQMIVALHNTKFRADCGRVMAASVRTDATPMREFFRIVMTPGFEARLAAANANPDSADARALVRLLAPLIMVTGAKVPFSALERGTRAAVELIAMVRFFGLPYAFLTIGPDETHTALVARMSCARLPGPVSPEGGPPFPFSSTAACAPDLWRCAQPDASFAEAASALPPLPAVDDGVVVWRQHVGDAITRDPTAVALVCQRLMNAVNEVLIGVPRREKRSTADFTTREPGMLGRAQAWFHVSEVMGRSVQALHYGGCPQSPTPCDFLSRLCRKMLHWHSLVWAGVSHWVTQRCAGAVGDLGAHVSSILSQAFVAHAEPALHAARLLRRINEESSLRAAYYAPPPPGLSGAEILAWGEAVIAATNSHSHCSTCHKGVMGESRCRLCYGRGTCTCTSPIALVSHSVNERIVPRAALAAPPPHLPVSADDSMHRDESVHRQLVRLAVPGGDFRLIDYPLLRPRVSVPLALVFPEDPAAAELELLQRQFKRLLDVYANLQMEPPRVSAAGGVGALRDAVAVMMRGACFGEVDEDSFLLADDAIAAVRALPVEKRTAFVDYLSTHNSILGESNAVGAAALGCNLNTQPLVSTESAFRAIFYIIDYVTKDSMQPADLLGFVTAARSRCTRFAGNAPAGEDPEAGDRPAQRLLQCVQNGLAAVVETSVQQCVLNVYGLPSHDCSEFFSFVFGTPALREYRAAAARAVGEGSGAAIENAVARALGPRLPPPAARGLAAAAGAAAAGAVAPRRAAQANGFEADADLDFDPYAANDGDAGTAVALPGLGTIHRTEEGGLATTSQDLQYKFRGDELSRCSLTEYACGVRRVPATSARGDETTAAADAAGNGMAAADDVVAAAARGRQPNAAYHFAVGYELAAVFQQRLASLLTIPIFGGTSSIPPWPSLSLEHLDSEELAEQQASFAEWVFVNLVPWPAPGASYADEDDGLVERLWNHLEALESGTFLLDADDGCFHGPPGYDDSPATVIAPGNPDFGAIQFSQQCLARFIGSLARGLRRPSPQQRKVQSAWRGRGAQPWGPDHVDPEQEVCPRDYARNSAAERAGGGGGPGCDDEEDEATPEEILAYAIELVNLRNARGGDEEDVDGEGLRNRERAFLATFEAAHGVIRSGDVAANPALVPVPAALAFPALGAFAAQADDIAALLQRLGTAVIPPPVRPPPAPAPGDGTGAAAAALRHLLSLPENAPNAGQARVLERLAEYFDALVAGQQPAAPRIFLDGAGGTGKSFLFSCIEKLAAAVGRTIDPTALTGVACCAIPTEARARTTASLFHLGIHPAQIRSLKGAALVTAREEFGDPLVVIIDEISFATPSILDGVDK